MRPFVSFSTAAIMLSIAGSLSPGVAAQVSQRTNRDTTPPSIDVPDSLTTRGEAVEFIGRVRDDSRIVRVSVGGTDVELGEDGRFRIRLRVTRSVERIEITASDEWGNKSSRVVVVARSADKLPSTADAEAIAKALDRLRAAPLRRFDGQWSGRASLFVDLQEDSGCPAFVDFRVAIDRGKFLGNVIGGDPAGGPVYGRIAMVDGAYQLAGIVPIAGWTTHPSTLDTKFDGKSFRGELAATGYCIYDAIINKER